MRWTILRQNASRWLRFIALATAIGLIVIGLALATSLGLI